MTVVSERTRVAAAKRAAWKRELVLGTETRADHADGNDSA
jgi:hypothetical protein